jgi:ribosomal protein L11 methyltransferase
MDLGGQTVIDFGCGSGILAVAALKLGASRAIAIDHDPQALEATASNAKKNSVIERVEILGSEETPDARADILVANILAGTLIDLEPLIAAHIKPGGRLALSGILAEQAQEVSDAYCADFTMEPPKQLEDWVLISGIRNSN